MIFQVSPELSRIDWEKMSIIAPSAVSTTSDDIDVENISSGEGNIIKAIQPIDNFKFYFFLFVNFVTLAYLI